MSTDRYLAESQFRAKAPPVLETPTPRDVIRYAFDEFQRVETHLEAEGAAPIAAAILQGQPESRGLSTLGLVVRNYGNAYEGTGFRGRTNDANGSITVPANGFYRITGAIIGDQGNSNQNEDTALQLDRNGVITDVVNETVATNRTTRRSWHFTLSLPLNADDVLRLRTWATTNLGTFTFDPACSFEVTAMEISAR